jgi:hypothetical protein
MAKLEQVARRSSLTSLWCGLVCLIFTIAAALAIWMYPFGGPDLRTDFIKFLMPGGALGVTFTLLGVCELRAGKHMTW